VLAGSSVGSIIAGIVATRTDEELREALASVAQLDVEFFNNRRAADVAHHFLHKGTLQVRLMQSHQYLGSQSLPR